MSRFVERIVAAATIVDDVRGFNTGEPHRPTRHTWTQVHERARRIAGALVDGGLHHGATVALLAATPSLIAPAAQAVWLCGGSVTMLHQPNPRTDLEAWTADTPGLLRLIKADCRQESICCIWMVAPVNDLPLAAAERTARERNLVRHGTEEAVHLDRDDEFKNRGCHCALQPQLFTTARAGL